MQYYVTFILVPYILSTSLNQRWTLCDCSRYCEALYYQSDNISADAQLRDSTQYMFVERTDNKSCFIAFHLCWLIFICFSQQPYDSGRLATKIRLSIFVTFMAIVLLCGGTRTGLLWPNPVSFPLLDPLSHHRRRK